MKYTNTQKESTRQRNFKSHKPRSGNKFSKKQLSEDLFVKKAAPVKDTRYVSPNTIDKLPVNELIIKNLLKKGYVNPTEIQDRTIEPILRGKNLMGLAQTGTGKTGAFLIPLINNLIGSKPSFQILIIAPTRELAVQTETEFRSISQGLKMFSQILIGGTSVRNDISNLRRPCHIVIGTPGRITDMVRQNALSLKQFSTLVLDEFDRLLDMGFSKDILRIVDGMYNRKQTVLFSATEDKTQKDLINKLLDNPVEVRLKNGNVSADNIDQEIIRLNDGQNKLEVLLGLVKDPAFEKVLIFDETKRGVSKICKKLRHAGIKADEIHGDKSQNYRIKALEAFKKRHIQVLVATDVAARGLDIVNVSHVINYQQPQNIDSYIHRIGRTGRAGKSGKAYTFVN